MTSKFAQVAIGSRNPRQLAEFWAEVLGYEITEANDEVVSLEAPDRSPPGLDFLAIPDPKTSKNRLHLDVIPEDQGQDEEVERIVGLGATRIDIGQGDDVSWVVLADPEGNEFCVLRPRHS